MILRFGLTFVLMSVTASASTAPPWKWTNEERIAHRIDRIKKIDRTAKFTMKAATAPGRSNSQLPEGWSVIDGNENPELFLPTELFERFVTSAFGDLKDPYRVSISDRSNDLFRNTSDWATLAVVAAPLVSALNRESELLRSVSTAMPSLKRELEAELVQVRQAQCAHLANTLRDARHTFGNDRFDQFLYEVVTVNLVLRIAEHPGESIDGYTRAAIRKESACK